MQSTKYLHGTYATEKNMIQKYIQNITTQMCCCTI